VSIAVIRFPGTNNENDVLRALTQIPSAKPYLVPSRKGLAGLKDAEGVIIPGGFSYGDYLRAGAVASVEVILEGIRDIADDGKPVLGICNGFQILAETGLLPGVLLPNQSSRFVCKWVYLRVSESSSVFTEHIEGAVIRLPIAHAEGNYFCPEDQLIALKDERRILFMYCDAHGELTPDANPNGSIQNIAGITNQRGNVVGMMPHPERASRPILGSCDGLNILENFVRATQ
jgi:phosphoribosylformylglycinamidine synthase I